MYVRLAILLSAVLLMNGAAHAEHKLLVTDVLDSGQYEASADFSYGHSYYDYTLKSPVFQQGRRIHDSAVSLYSFGFGVADGFQLSLRVPYVFHDRTKFNYVLPAFPSRAFDNEGWGDLELGGRYRLTGGEGKPLTLVAGLNVKLDSADKNKEGSGTTDISPYIAIGTAMNGGTLRPYASYQAVVRNHGTHDSHLLTIGSEYKINKDVSLAPSFRATFRTSSTSQAPYESYELSLAGYFQLFHNFYLTPSAGGGISTASHTKDGALDFETLKFVNVGLGLYYLFN
jgi:hypothetical protein